MGFHLGVGIGKLQYVHSRETLKLRNVYDPDFVRLNVLFSTSGQIPEVPYRHCMGLRKISHHLRGQKSEDLPLGLELSGKGRLGDLMVRLLCKILLHKV